MAKLGSERRPVIVRVQTAEAAQAITAACTAHGWECIAGVEPDQPEDISDFERLMNPTEPARSVKVGRNEPCPCGSGRKFKRCCAERDTQSESTVGELAGGRFRYETGSYGGPASGYAPSILCYERQGPDSWREYFCLANPVHAREDADAASAVADEHLAAAYAQAVTGGAEDFAQFLRDTGYVRVSEFRKITE